MADFLDQLDESVAETLMRAFRSYEDDLFEKRYEAFGGMKMLSQRVTAP